jgi:hypothetical protein
VSGFGVDPNHVCDKLRQRRVRIGRDLWGLVGEVQERYLLI